MSILVVHLVPQGILFGADRNITTQVSSTGLPTVQGQSQRPKVLKWPNREAIVGYVGAASIDGTPTDLWLYHSFIGCNLNFTSFQPIVENLKTELEIKMTSGILQEMLIIHIAGFEKIGGEWTPVVWFLRNTRMDSNGDYVPHTSFECSEEISDAKYFGQKTGSEIRRNLEQWIKNGGFFSFRQGFDLGAFNALDSFTRLALQAIVQSNRHPFPNSLDEWGKHVKMAILTYGAYFEAFYEPFEQYVGGGADVVWAEWPPAF
jgi:hypothetical protein